MFRTLKAVLNNLNETHYLKKRMIIRFKKTDSSLSDTAEKKLAENKEEIERLQGEVRHENLRIFTSNVLKARCKQTVLVTLPALMVAANIGIMTIPNKTLKTEEISAFVKKETIFTEEQQIPRVTDGNIYYYSLIGRDFVSETDISIYNMDVNKSELSFLICDDLDGFLATIDILSDGRLVLRNINSGKFIDLSKYDFSNATDIEEKYLMLFDEIVDYIIDSNNLLPEYEEKLLNMSQSEKRDIMIKIVEWESIGDRDVEFYANNVGWKILWTLLTVAYIAIEALVISKSRIKDSNMLSSQDGELIEDYQEEKGLFLLVFKYKLAFLKAEQERIKRLYELYSESLDPIMFAEDMLTPYERKLIGK